MTSHVKSLAHQAMLESIEVRDQCDRELDGPLDVYALCQDMGVKVRFVALPSMEGLYGRDDDGSAVILLSSMRPLPRRAFSCAHELGHQVFGHGATVDEILDGARAGGTAAKRFEPNEFTANTFAGFLLMPTLGVRKAFATRGWDARSATPAQVYAVACHFGVGYDTLVSHLAHALQSITLAKADELRRVGPQAIRQQVLGAPSPDPLVIADEFWALPTIDVEVGTQLLLPEGAAVDAGAGGGAAIVVGATPAPRERRLFKAVRPGIVRVAQPGSTWAVFVRVARYQFAGLVQYRHLEVEEDDHE